MKILLILVFVGLISAHQGSAHQEDIPSGVHGVHLYSWRWSEFHSEIIIAGLIIFSVIFKIFFHRLENWCQKKPLPESCVFILVGIVFGLFTTTALSGSNNYFPAFTANLFFNILLPPIILDSAICLYNKEFLATFNSVMVFAVFGTLFNVFAIGLCLYGFSQSGVLGDFVDSNSTSIHTPPGLLPCLTFASLISAVDPVAVLAIFEQIGVNAGLYFLVFGESLFNDGVTVVLYNSMNTLAELPAVGGHDICMAFLSFFTVVLGGAFIGVFNGLFVSIITRFTKHVRVVEPLIILISAYSAFLWAEVFHWSGIISIISYGITAKHYAFQNISQKSFTTVKYSVKTMASTSDCVIFIFLGISIFTEKHYCHPGFIIATIVLCLLFRLLSTFIFSALVNLKRIEKITFKEQVIIVWGGLRGAVGFSLSMVLKEDLWYRELFLTTALVMVLFTVFLQGGTIKLLVKLLKIKLEEDRGNLISVEVQDKVMEDICDGMKAVCGSRGTHGKLMEKVKGLDETMKTLLIHNESKDQLTRRFEKITVNDHFTNLYAPRLIIENLDLKMRSRTTTTTMLDPSDATTDSLQIFREGVKQTNWNMLRQISKEGNDRKRTQTMMAEMDNRKIRTKTILEELSMGSSKDLEATVGTILDSDPKLSDEMVQKLKAQYRYVQAMRKPVSCHSTIV